MKEIVKLVKIRKIKIRKKKEKKREKNNVGNQMRRRNKLKINLMIIYGYLLYNC